MMTPAMVMELIVKTLDTRMGKDIKVLKTDAITPLADYFVICTATTTSHIRTLSDEVEKILKEHGETPCLTAKKFLLLAIPGSLILVGPVLAFAKFHSAFSQFCRLYNQDNFPANISTSQGKGGCSC